MTSIRNLTGFAAMMLWVGHAAAVAQSTVPANPPPATVPITSQTPAGAVNSMPAAAQPPVKQKKKKKNVPKEDRPVAYAESAKVNNAAYEKQKAAAAAKNGSTASPTPDSTKQPQ